MHNRIGPTLILVAGLTVAGATAAHEGVQNAAVLERMTSMTQMGDHLKVIGQMARGQTERDLEAARDAVLAIAFEADRTPALFEGGETDPRSEAKPVIWDDFEEFVAKSDVMSAVAREAADDLTNDAALRPLLAALADACADCHEAYRE